MPTRHGIMDLGVWLEQEIHRLGVDVKLSTYMDVDDVIDGGAEAVIVATGSRPRMDGIQNSHPGEPIRGIDRPHVLSSVELLMGRPQVLGGTAVVIDDAGHFERLGSAEYLVSQGLSVIYITRLHRLAPHVEATVTRDFYLQRLVEQPIEYLTRTRAISIEPGEVLVGPSYLTNEQVRTSRLPADTVVFVSPNHPNRALFTALSDRNSEIYVVGDANAPRYLPVAVREGHLAGARI